MPTFRTLDMDLLLPERGICHKVRKIPRPHNLTEFPFFHEREDLMTRPGNPQPRDIIILQREESGVLVYYEIKALRG